MYIKERENGNIEGDQNEKKDPRTNNGTGTRFLCGKMSRLLIQNTESGWGKLARDRAFLFVLVIFVCVFRSLTRI